MGFRLEAPVAVVPHHPDFTGPCGCRKPGTELFERAAHAHELDLSRSLYFGDRMRDLAAVRSFGGAGFLISSPRTTPDDLSQAGASGITVLPSLLDAVRAALSR